MISNQLYSGVRAAEMRVTTTAGRTMPCKWQGLPLRAAARTGEAAHAMGGLRAWLSEPPQLPRPRSHLYDEYAFAGLEDADAGQRGGHQRHVPRRCRRQLRLLAQRQEQALRAAAPTTTKLSMGGRLSHD